MAKKQVNKEEVISDIETPIQAPVEADHLKQQSQEAYNQLKDVFEKVLNNSHFDIDYQRQLKREAGIL